ncbi:hypothetical protein BDB00DRAFT_855087 [Zychaea mexicana]|uniref:uncharacterized protein n=1 Tax=Zychaea mexicana TaxID=64656 RepID=UPI0022FE49CD|nr:uncharacterized protein BDB00DRAFT_855087 [Zychaea mexicana]KAI9484532.1 hypothetical protein BDB00DRAFT_855087 [Zychaea mexicana]
MLPSLKKAKLSNLSYPLSLTFLSSSRKLVCFSFSFYPLLFYTMMQRQFSTFKLLEPTSAAAAVSSSSSSTDKVILDYLLYISIQSRLKQAGHELIPSSPSDKVYDHLDTACKAAERNEKAAADSTVAAGILSSYHNDYHPESTPFQQRLYLYLLSNHTLARYNALSNDHVIVRRRKLDKEHTIFATPITPLSCRRHRHPACESCPARTSKKKSGLMDAIPTFLKTSADLLRRALDNGSSDNNTSEHQQQTKPMVFAGQQVMGGGMPPTWYDLFLNLLTQAAIECYMCDGQTGPEPISEIFSYGYVEDEDEPDEADDDDDTDNSDDDDDEEDDDDDDDDDEEEETWNVKAADYHLLFPKTRTMYLFKTQVREREKEFLVVHKGDDGLQQHFEKLARRYPLLEFEKSMHEFIHMVFESLEVPALNKYGEADVASIVYRYPSDGSLLMPEVPDDESSICSGFDQPSSSASSSFSLSPPSSASTSSSSLAEEEAAAVTAVACAASIPTGTKRTRPEEHVKQHVPRKKIAQ